MRRGTPPRVAASRFKCRKAAGDARSQSHGGSTHPGSGRGGMGTAVGRRVHRPRRGRGGRQRLGAGALPDGRAAGNAGVLRHHHERHHGDSALPRGRAPGDPAHARRRDDAQARRCRRRRLGEHRGPASSPRPGAEASLRLSHARRGGRAARDRRHGHSGFRAGRSRIPVRPARPCPRGAWPMTHFLVDILPIALLGGLLGLDVVCFPQAMISRPLLAAPAGGALIGHALSGMMVGAALELIALETLPFGAARYPEWGSAATVGGALYARHVGDPAGAMTMAVLAAVATAWIGGWSMIPPRLAHARAGPRPETRLAPRPPATGVGLPN